VIVPIAKQLFEDRLALPQRHGAQVLPICIQYIEGDIDRRVRHDEQIETRPTGSVEHHDLTVENAAARQVTKQRIEALWLPIGLFKTHEGASGAVLPDMPSSLTPL
jgi:hypothetical protein